MKRFIKKILVLCAILLIGAIVMDVVFTKIFKSGRTVKAQWLNNMHGQHYDLVITGSSRAWWNIDMHRINSSCGIRSVNLATNHFRPAEILLALKIFLANGNSVDRMLLELDYMKKSESDQVFSATIYDHLPWLKDELVYDHLRSRSNEFFWLRHIPFARYARYNSLWGPEEAIITLLDKRRTLFDSTGSYFTDDEFSGYAQLQLNDIVIQYDEDLAEVFNLCRKNGIEVEVFMAPYYRLRVRAGAKEEFNELMDRYGVAFHDHSDRLDSTIHFNDNWHLGRHGGEVYTQMLIDELICPGGAIVPAGTE